MFRRLLTAAAAAVSMFVCAGAPATAQAPAAPAPLEAYGKLPMLEEVVISPDGEKLAYIAVVGESRRVAVQTLAGQQLGAVGLGDQKVRDVRWGGPNHLLITTSSTGRVCEMCDKGENFIVQSYNVTTRKFTLMMATHNGAVGAFVSGPPTVRRVNGADIVLVNGYLERKINDTIWYLPSPFRVNLDTGHGSLFDFNSGVMDDRGVIVAMTDLNGDRWRLIRPEGKTTRELMVRTIDVDAPLLYGHGRTPGTVIVSELVQGEVRYHEVDLNSGKITPLQLPFPGAEPIIEARSDRLLGFSGWVDDVYRVEYVDPDFAAGWARVVKTFAGRNPSVASWTTDRTKAVIHAEGPGSTGDYFLMDFTVGKATLIGSQYPTIKTEQVNEVRYVRYKAADGLEIPAFLTLPRGRDPKNLPLVVYPHGGPQARDYPGFDWWAQAMASRGYAVLQPQFRGSDGYGVAFVEAGYGQWGRKMQTDLSDGVRWLAAEGVIDPKRVCIVGASYGGYAAMAGPALEPGLYRCAVAVAGVSDLKRMLKEEKRSAGGSSNARSVRYWRRYLGADRINDSSLNEISPVNLVERIDAPMLLIHGKDDLVVPYGHSEQLAKALARAGKTHELVTLKGEDHWLTRGATRLQMLNATVAFLEKHNPPA